MRRCHFTYRKQAGPPFPRSRRMRGKLAGHQTQIFTRRSKSLRRRIFAVTPVRDLGLASAQSRFIGCSRPNRIKPKSCEPESLSRWVTMDRRLTSIAQSNLLDHRFVGLVRGGSRGLPESATDGLGGLPGPPEPPGAWVKK